MKITITRTWSDYQGVTRSVDYPPGEYDVDEDVAARAALAGVIEETGEQIVTIGEADEPAPAPRRSRRPVSE